MAAQTQTVNPAPNLCWPNSGGWQWIWPGTFTDPLGVAATISGATTTAFFRIDAWIPVGLPGFGFGTSGVFSNPVGLPPGTPPDFVNMPAVIINCAPEPCFLSLLGLGAVGLLIFRYRRS